MVDGQRDPRALDAVAALCIRDVPRDSPRQVAAWLAAQSDLPARDRLLVQAAIAARAGAPQAAVELVAADTSALAAARRLEAQAARRNRFPGGRGAVLEEGDAEAFLDPPAPDTADAGEAILTIAIGAVEAMVGNWRSISSGTALGLPLALERVAVLRSVAERTGARWLGAYLWLVEADLRRLGGDGGEAERIAALAMDAFRSAGDALGVAACCVAIGDWHAAPRTSPELLDLSIDDSPPTPGTRDVSAARAMYDQARAVYEGGCELGLAALLLRDGHVARTAGDIDAWAEAAGRATQLADHADDRWLAGLAATHASLAAIEAGGRGGSGRPDATRGDTRRRWRPGVGARPPAPVPRALHRAP